MSNKRSRIDNVDLVSETESNHDDAEKYFCWKTDNDIEFYSNPFLLCSDIPDSNIDCTVEHGLQETACSNLYQDAQTSDIEIWVRNKSYQPPRKSTPQTALLFGAIYPRTSQTFYAHKSILAASCQKFREMFYGPNKKVNYWGGDLNYIGIYNVCVDTFEQFFRCFYFRNVSFKLRNISGVMKLAQIFDVPDCMKSCVECLKYHISPDTFFFFIYKLANEFKQPELSEYCNVYARLNTESVFQAKDFTQQEQKILKQILAITEGISF